MFVVINVLKCFAVIDLCVCICISMYIYTSMYMGSCFLLCMYNFYLHVCLDRSCHSYQDDKPMFRMHIRFYVRVVLCPLLEVPVQDHVL